MPHPTRPGNDPKPPKKPDDKPDKPNPGSYPGAPGGMPGMPTGLPADMILQQQFMEWLAKKHRAEQFAAQVHSKEQENDAQLAANAMKGDSQAARKFDSL